MRTFANHLKYGVLHRTQAGQAIILLAFAMVGLLAFVGLVTDISLLFVRFSQLRRAVDAASIAAAGQVRENRDYADLALTARQFIRLHGLDPERVLVQTCVTNPGDTELCTNPPRKLVRVVAQIDSPTTFLRLIGWQMVTLETSSLAETASLDVALVLDTSESMARDTVPASYLMADPAFANLDTFRDECDDGNQGYYGCCNDPGTGEVNLEGDITLSSFTPDNLYQDLVCMPFKHVKDAARQFLGRMDFTRGDRVVFVTFDNQTAPVLPVNPSGPGTLDPLITDEGLAVWTLDRQIGVGMNHRVHTGINGFCFAMSDPVKYPTLSYAFTANCMDTNMGGGLQAAQAILTHPNYIRRSAVWVIILLSDGAANATPPATRANAEGLQEDVTGEYGEFGYCPWYTFCDPVNNPFPECPGAGHLSSEVGNPFCFDEDATTRHFCMNAEGIITLDAPNCSPDYDAMDYAMDQADLAGLDEVLPNVSGNFIAMYSIGFGDQVSAAAEATLRYVADAGDNGQIDNNWQQDCRDDAVCGNNSVSFTDLGEPDVCEGVADRTDCGQYWYASDLDKLERVFAEIASRLFTRLSR